MRIPEHTEERLRDAFLGVVSRNGDRVTEALRGLDEQESRTALALALIVCGSVVNDLWPDGPMDDDELRELAQEVVTEESSWVNVGDIETVTDFLRGTATGSRSFADMATENLVGLALVCGGYLLTTYRGEHPHWWDYLDEIWARVESTPEPA